MQFKPHEYQKFATQFIIEHPESAVFLDLGLGKTVITLSAISELMYERFEIKGVLIIAPLRICTSTWPTEIKKWDFSKDLVYSVVVGTEKERLEALSKKADIFIINRENVDWLINKSGFRFKFDMVVIDELSSFKSYSSKRFKALMKVRPHIKRIVGLTGTPSSNGLMDLWAEYRLLDMGERLGRFIGSYRLKYFMPDKQNGAIVYSYKPLEGAEEAIYKRIGDITISMKACDHLKMPKLITSEVVVEMSETEKKRYDGLKQDMVVKLDGVDIDAVNAAALTNKLTQMSNGAIYDRDKNIIAIHKRKLDALEDLIEAANGKPLLVAYWFKHDLMRIKNRFDVREIKNADDIDDWNAGKIPVALIHPASAGHGINLQQGGNTLVWYGLTWSLELYMQTNGRLYRQGQESGTVIINHIITKGTMDERILQALKQKEKVQDALIDAVKAELEVK